MRVALVSKVWDEAGRGNHTTVTRWRSLVEGAEVIPVSVTGRDARLESVDLVHGYHALHGGPQALALSKELGCPCVISLGGTDLFGLIEGDEHAHTTRKVLLEADLVTGALTEFAAVLNESLGRRVSYVAVPRSVAVVPKMRRRERQPGTPLRVLLPSGLRLVKDPGQALRMERWLHRAGIPIRLTIAGRTWGDAFSRSIRAEASDRVTFAFKSPHKMSALYRRHDVVWNTSRFEGGANALLEALNHGCALLARHVPGNREMLGGAEAFSSLFRTGSDQGRGEVVRFHRDLLAEDSRNRALRRRRARAWLRAHHRPELEAEALRGAWSRALS